MPPGSQCLEVAWVVRLVLAEAGALPQASLLPIFIGLVVLELSLPLWSERRRRTSWHPHHIAERYGLFAIILLGEVHPRRVVQGRVGDRRRRRQRGAGDDRDRGSRRDLCALVALLSRACGSGLARNPDRAVLWGCFGQYGVFAALAGLGAGLEVAIEQTGNQVRLSPVAVSYAVAIPVGLFLVLLWAVSAIIAGRSAIRPIVILGGAAVIAARAALSRGHRCGLPCVAAIAAVCASMIAATILMDTTQGARRRTSAAVARLVEFQPGGPRSDADVVAVPRA